MNLGLVLLLSFMSTVAFARVDIEYSRTGSETNYSNIISLGYSLNSFVDEKTENIGLNSYIGYVYSDALSVSNLNANLADFEIMSKSHELSYSMTFSETLTLSFSGGISQYNGQEARSDSLGLGIYYQFEKMQIGYDYEENLYKQVKSVVILTQDITDRVRFKQKAQSFYLDYQWTETFLVKLLASTYSYQTYGNVADMDSFSSTATGVVFLNAAGPSMAEQSYAQIKNSLDLGFLYNFSDQWLLDLGLQRSTDQLAPNPSTTALSLGVEYTSSLDDFDYSITGSATGSKTENVDGNSFTGLFAISISF